MPDTLKVVLLGWLFCARFAAAAERWSTDADVRAALTNDLVQFNESFTDQSFHVDAYSAKSAYLFAVRGEGTQPFAYRLAPVTQATPAQWQVTAHEPLPLSRESGERRIATLAERDAPSTAADARRLFTRMLTARAEWQSAQREIATATERDPEKAHEAWGRIAQRLESAAEKCPEHLGILSDLIAAYTQLLAFERDTDRGHAICRLLPLRIRDYELRAGTLTPQENDSLTRNRTLWYFLTERYPLARQSLDQLNARPDTEAMLRSLAAIHQDRFDELPRINSHVEKHRYEIAVFSTRRSSPEPGIQHHLRYFFPRPVGAGDGQTWFTLTTQQLTDQPRYYLLGWEGNRAKVLRLFGTKMPTDDEVTAEVRRLVTAALTSARTSPGGP